MRDVMYTVPVIICRGFGILKTKKHDTLPSY